MRSFALLILDAGTIAYKGKARHCGLMTADGGCGLEAGHATFLALLSPGSTFSWTDEYGTVREIKIRRGMVKFLSNACSVLVDLASPVPA